MGDLALDTEVDGDDGHYVARLSPDWEIWGPNGGYVVSVAMRAAARSSVFERPASVVAHYLGVASFEHPVEISVVPLRRARTAESLRISMTQVGRPVLEALVWAVPAGGEGLRHDTSRRPDVPPPEALKPVEELAPDAALRSPPFFRNFEQRATEWIDDWDHRPSTDPAFSCWYRYRPTATFDDPWVDACRSLILCDTLIWPAVQRHHVGDHGFVAPSIDLAVTFLRAAPDREWLLASAEAPGGEHGLLNGRSDVWADDGTHLASAMSTLLCRRAR